MSISYKYEIADFSDSEFGLWMKCPGRGREGYSNFISVYFRN